MWLAIGLLAFVWLAIVGYASVMLADDDDDRAMAAYRAEVAAFEEQFE